MALGSLAPLGFERRVAVRFLREGRMQSLLIIVGVAAGVAVVTYISALISGLQTNTLNKTLGAQAHVTLRSPDNRVAPAWPLPQAPAPASSAVGGAAGAATATATLTDTQPRTQRLRAIVNWQAMVPLLEAMPGVAAVSPMVSGAGLAQRGEASRAVTVTGVELDRYDRIVHLRDKVVAGVPRLSPGDAIVGRELADDLGLRVGDRFGLLTGTVADALRVSAVVDLGARELNRRTLIVPLRTAQSQLGLPGGATSLELALVDVWSAGTLADELSQRFPYKLESWQEANAQLVSALNAQTISTGLIRAVVMVVVVLGIASVLVVSVVQKRREIGILRAMGATRGQVMRIFLLQGAIVGAIGSVLGVLLAGGLVKLFTTFVRGSDGGPLFPITLTPGLAALVAVAATVCGVLAAVAPARRAAALDPAQAIRM